MTENSSFFIDVEKVIRSKNGNKKPAALFVKFLKKIVHQDEMNEILSKWEGGDGFKFIDYVLNYFNVEIEEYGLENIPKEGKFVFASNHPLGGMDGMATGLCLARHYNGSVRLLVNDLLMFMKPLKDIFVPVNVLGGQGRDTTDHVNQAYMSENQLVVFPAGACSRRVKGKIQDLEWKKNFLTKAIEFQRDIIPVYFEGKNSRFFYALANFRKFIGIKLNIELLFLPDEMFKQRNKKFKIYIGKPIPWQTFDKSKTPKQWSQEVRSAVYKLSKN